jgi:hypothetical protein
VRLMIGVVVTLVLVEAILSSCGGRLGPPPFSCPWCAWLLCDVRGTRLVCFARC